jgi:hypothetical protein
VLTKVSENVQKLNVKNGKGDLTKNEISSEAIKKWVLEQIQLGHNKIFVLLVDYSKKQEVKQ